jgi:hypothetical protein
MFMLSGKLINIFETPKGKTKEGEEYGGDFKLQILHENTLRNGEKRADLVELAVSDTTPYRDKLNATVNVPVAVSVWQGRLSVKAAL